MNIAQLVRIASGEVPSNISEQNQALNQLQNLANDQVGFSNVVLGLHSNDLGVDSKILICSLLKFLVKTRWNNRGNGSVLPVEEKELIKSNILSCPNFYDRRVFLHIGNIVAKISRIEWPKSWDNLFPVIIGYCQSSSINEKIFGLQLLCDTLSELRSVRLSGITQIFSQACVPILPVVRNLLQVSVVSLSSDLNRILSDQNGVNFQEIIKNCEISGKCFHSLFFILSTLFGTESDSLIPIVEEVKSMLEMLYTYICKFKTLLSSQGWSPDDIFDNSIISNELYPVVNNNSPVLSIFHGLSRDFGTVLSSLTALVEAYPIDIAPFLESCMTMFYSFLIQEAQLSFSNYPMDSSVVISSLKVCSFVLTCKLYKENCVNEDGIRAGSVASIARKIERGKMSSENESMYRKIAFEAKHKFFSERIVLESLDLLLKKLLHFGPKELEEWSNDPETFVVYLDSCSANDSVRCGAEKYYLELLEFAPTVVIPRVMQLLSDIDSQKRVASNSLDLHVEKSKIDENILFWDALYVCIGLSSSVLSQNLDPSVFLTEVISPIIQVIMQSPKNGTLSSHQQVIRARMLWLISCWLGYFSESVLADLFNLLHTLFGNQEDSDVVVSLFAVQLLENVLRSLKFTPELLTSHVVHLTQCLCGFVMKLEEAESRQRVVIVIGEMWKAAGPAIQPLTPSLAQFLGSMWSSDGNDMLNAAILQTLTELVKVASSSLAIHDICLPLVRHALLKPRNRSSALNIDQDSCENEDQLSPENLLLAQGVELWLALIRNISMDHYVSSLDQLANDCINALMINCSLSEECGEETWKSALMAIESHCILSGSSLLLPNQVAWKAMLEYQLKETPPRSLSVLVRPLEALFLRCPQDTCEFLLQSGLLSQLMMMCCPSIPQLKDALSEHCYADIAVVVVMSLLARVFLHHPRAFQHGCVQVIQGLSDMGISSNELTADFLIFALAGLWLEFYDSLDFVSAGSWRRKLWCMALWNCYPPKDSTTLSWLPDLIFKSEGILRESQEEARDQQSLSLIATLLTSSSLDQAYSVGSELAVSADAVVMVTTQALEVDVVHGTNIRDLVRSKMQELMRIVPEATLSSLLESCGAAFQYVVHGQ